MNPAGQLTPQQRRKQFLVGLGNVMLQRGVPLPPQLTGVPYPQAYDPTGSPWRSLDISNVDVGVVRIAGKDVDLYRLWAFVTQAGGSAKVRRAYLPSKTLIHHPYSSASKTCGGSFFRTLSCPNNSYNLPANHNPRRPCFSTTSYSYSDHSKRHTARTRVARLVGLNRGSLCREQVRRGPVG